MGSNTDMDFSMVTTTATTSYPHSASTLAGGTMYGGGGANQYLGAKSDGLLTTSSYSGTIMSTVPVPMDLDTGYTPRSEQQQYRCSPQMAYPSPSVGSSYTGQAESPPPLQEGGHYQRGAATTAVTSSPPPLTPLPLASPSTSTSKPSTPEPDSERTINYEELKMKIAYKKFERECIMEFDGDTVLCRVCGDKASGFHYGVHACEGCKGFFRRSIQQKIQYRPCLKNQQCNIMRVNRNRCQYCRLKKCIAVGMSRDAVRFGRVPKKEKAKILEQMQKVNQQSQQVMLSSVLDHEPNFIQKIIDGHMSTSEFSKSKFAQFYEKAWVNPKFIDCPAHMACPLNPAPEEDDAEKWDDFTDCFTPAIRNVVNFAKCIPGFTVFSQEDQVTLLKAGTFEVLLLQLACLFDSKSNTMMFANGKLFKRSSITVTNSAGFLLDSMFDFADRLNDLKLSDHEMALFSAIVIIAADRPGLRNVEHIERVQSRISAGLHALMKSNHPDDPAAFTKLLTKIPDLRTLNTLHSEKLLGLTVPEKKGEMIDEKPRLLEPNATVARCPFPSSGGPYSPPMNATQMSVSSCYPGVLPLHHPLPLATSTPLMDGPSVVPHMQHSKEHQQQQEVVLQTSMGTFHRYSSSPTSGSEHMPANPRSTLSSPDPLEMDLPPSAAKESRLTPPRTSPPPLLPITQESRKRPLDSLQAEMQCKMAKLYNLWDFDMRSNRSNSMSSNSSMESADSAYKSSPGTPRSMLQGARSPFLEPTNPAPKSEPGIDLSAGNSSTSTSSSESVLKHALSIPPLVAQHTWFHHPSPGARRAGDKPHPGMEDPAKLERLLEYSRRAAHDALTDPAKFPAPSSESQPPPPPPHDSGPWKTPITSSSGYLPPPPPAAFPHPAAAAMMYHQYNQMAAMQQYAAMQQHLQQQQQHAAATMAAHKSAASGHSSSHHHLQQQQHQQQQPQLSPSSNSDAAPLNLTTKSPPLPIPAAVKIEPM